MSPLLADLYLHSKLAFPKLGVSESRGLLDPDFDNSFDNRFDNSFGNSFDNSFDTSFDNSFDNPSTAHS